MIIRTAIIDIGSNSVRMAIFEQNSQKSFLPIYEVKSSVRISENAYLHNKNLQPKAIKRAYNALREFKMIALSYGVEKIFCVATSAVRDAPNKEHFINLIKNRLDIDIEVINGKQEAYYGALACSYLLHKVKGITIDTGGGSTEISMINGFKISNQHSLKLGTVRLKELFFDKNNINGAIKYIDNTLSCLNDSKIETAIGIGGTFRALSKVMMETTKYPLKILHGYSYDAKILLELIDKILNSDKNELLKIGIKKDRIDVIKPGALILSRIIKKFNIKNIITSGVGVRDGVFLEKCFKGKISKNINPSIEYLINRYSLQPKHIQNVTKIASKLFDLLYEDFKIEKRYKRLFLQAVKLANIGESINFYSYHQHSYYFVLNTLKYGLSHKDILFVATLVRYQKKKRPPEKYFKYFKSILDEEKSIRRLSSILSLSYSLLYHHPKKIDYKFDLKHKTLFVHCNQEPYLSKELINSTDLLNEISVKFIEKGTN